MENISVIIKIGSTENKIPYANINFTMFNRS